MPNSGEVIVVEVAVVKVETVDIFEETIELVTHLIAKISLYQTFKIAGEILGHSVCILINSRASHNLISEALARKINLPIMATKNFRVTVRDGYQLNGVGIYKNIKLKCKGLKSSKISYQLNLGILILSWE